MGQRYKVARFGGEDPGVEVTTHDQHETCRACGHGIKTHISTGCIVCSCPQFVEPKEEPAKPRVLRPGVVPENPLIELLPRATPEERAILEAAIEISKRMRTP